jgi:beta-lactamase class D
MISPRFFPICALLITLVYSLSARAEDFREVPAVAAAFTQAGLTGTFVLLDPVDGSLSGHDSARAHRPYIPASTFKIANALIGLDCGSVASVDEVLPYGGKPQPVPEWEHDMSLRAGIKISNVPVFQELARRTGLARMKAGLAKLHYGNTQTGSVVDQFWLQGPLQISAVEQTQFLHRLATSDLPVTKAALAAVQEITLQDPFDGLPLHGKTGWCTSTTPAIGWYVGWVEKDGRAYCFALNIDMPDISLAPKRIPLAKDCVRLLLERKDR